MLLTLSDTRRLNADVFRWELSGFRVPVCPGQFVQVAIPGFYLRRPISVCDWSEDRLVLVFREVGSGTQAMASMPMGSQVEVLGPLGHGFDLSRCGRYPLLVGGGVGLPPLIGLAKALLQSGRDPLLIAGFRSGSDLFLRDEAEALGIRPVIMTEDGSIGRKGLVTDALASMEYDSLCACGPLPMLRALHRAVSVPAQYSLEERMGCGFGACMGCSMKTKKGPMRVCAEGPVFPGEVLDW